MGAQPPRVGRRRDGPGGRGEITVGHVSQISGRVEVGADRRHPITTHRARSWLTRNGWALAASGLALLLALSLGRLIESGPFLLFLAAVTVSAWYGGLGPGLLATGVGALAGVYFFFAPTYSLQIANLNAAVQLTVFALVAVLISSLNANLRAAQRRAEIARADAEAAQRRLAFLAEASTVPDASLDYEQTLQSAARLVVPTLADWCVVHIVIEEGRSVQRLTVADGDPAKEKLVRELQHRGLVDADAPAGVRKVLSSGQGVLCPEGPDGLVGEADSDAKHLQLLRLLGFRSAMIVPLVAAGRTLGAITLVSVESGRRYGPADLALAEDFARHAALAIDSARLYREAQQAIRGRDEVLAVASHDLKSPLTFIKGQAQLLQRLATGAGASQRSSTGEGLARIEAATNKMVRLIDQLLEVARLQMGQSLELERRPTNLVDLARKLAAEHQHTTRGHQIRVQATEPELVGMWDGSQLERVLSNLLANAVKYSPAGGEIMVCVGREADATDGWAVLAITDQGLGIPAGERRRVFERFCRASNVAGQISGHGVGLAGARQIVEQHGGSISVDSREGAGSTFTVRLPLPATPGPADAERRARTG